MTTYDQQPSMRAQTVPDSAVSEPDLIAMYQDMVRIRRFETRASGLYKGGKIPGFLHLSTGQEASAVGASFYLRPTDVVTSTHRGHGHALAKGIQLDEMFAELMGKESGVCSGRGGSMHIADPARGIFGANGIVGAGLPIADGAALAAQLAANGDVVVAFLGDGAISTGAFHEAVNLAALWHLPVIFWCENNRYSEFSSFEDQHVVSVGARATAYGIPFRSVDGNDVVATSALARDLLESLRGGEVGPILVEALTLRRSGHYVGDPELYRRDDSGFADPIEVAKDHLLARGMTQDSLDAIEREVRDEIEAAVTVASAAPFPDPADLYSGMLVTRDRVEPSVLALDVVDAGAPTWKMYEAIRAALVSEMEDDERVFLAGIDVGRGGNVFGVTKGMHERWPNRVLDTPISEMAIMGLGVGSAMAGLHPVVELMYFDFLGVCLDGLMNQAAKLPYMTGGRAKMGLTVRTQFGAGRSSGAQHSQSLEAMIAHIPGLTVVMPSTPADAYGLLKSAIRDDNPVVFVENRLQYGLRGPKVPRDHLVPIGQAAIRRQGSDVTIVSYSRMVHMCCAAADELRAEGISCEVIDLRTIAPLDMTAIMESVSKTNRLIVVHEAVKDFGVGAEIAARMADEGMMHLDAPVRRIGALGVPAPYSPPLEQAWLPQQQDIVDAVRELVRW